MFASTRYLSASRAAFRTFSTSTARSADMAKLCLIGRLGKEPELRTTQNNKEYVSYAIATTNFPPPPPNPDGSKNAPGTTWHQVVCFNPAIYEYLRKLPKGSLVYCEANYELREPAPGADPETPQGQRQIFLRHENLRLLRSGSGYNTSGESSEEST